MKVSAAGLGCGGFSRLGKANGNTETESADIVRLAVELGVNFIDTAVNYGTESIVGLALRDISRSSVVISTKHMVLRGDELLPASEVVKGLEGSLRRLGVDYVDVFHLHGVVPATYDHALNVVVPELLKERERGKFRFLGITEAPPRDEGHRMLHQALKEDCFDVMMVAFHMLHQSARELIFPQTLSKGIGVLNMFAVRQLFSRPERLREELSALVRRGLLPGRLGESGDPLDFLVREGGARSLIETAYRYCRHEPGVEVVLTGTGNAGHLRANIASILRPPLAEHDLHRIAELFGGLEGIGLDAAGRAAP